ncbi:MAG: transporter [candidate division SR1 bacterium CG_4_9_14_3_um_filter_40_9]|nr:MAG: transporter [candidate division SR1 bacterium CG_4_9_14_3_um_filter_40_9]
MQKNYKFITLITVFFVAVLMISNITSTKILDFGPFTFDGGTLLFPLSYIFGDVITEVYGYKQSRKIIWMGFGALLLMSVMIIVVGLLPASKDRAFQADYQHILGFTPRIVMASLIAFLAGEFSNSYILAKIKIRMKGKKLRVRTIGSTLVGEGLDTIIFVVVAFYGVFPTEVLRAIIVSNYIFKVGIEVVFTPLTYLVTNRLKKVEHEDYYDNHTNFNPVKL